MARCAATAAAALTLGGREADAFRTLRANLRYYDIDRDIRSLLVTSSAPGDGKSTVARYLAATPRRPRASASVLVEADLRRPSAARALPGRARARAVGRADRAGAAGGDDPALPVALAGAPAGRTLDVIAAGAPPPNPTDLLESERMSAVLGELHARYDLVVVDSSPVTIVPDSLALLRQVTGVLVVVREAKTTIAGTRRLRTAADNLGDRPARPRHERHDAGRGRRLYGYYAYAPPPDLREPVGSGSAR